MKNPGLDHFQNIFHRQCRIDPFDLDRRQLTQGQLLVDFMQGIAGGAGTGQGQGPPGQLLDPLKAAFALASHQHHGHVVHHRIAGHQATGRGGVEQFARRHQIGFAALQRRQQLLLGPRNDFQADFLAIAGAAIEVVLKGTQPVIFHAHRLAFDFAGAVAALVDQHLEDPAAANLRQVADLGFAHRLLRTGQARAGRACQKQPKAQHDQQKQRSGHPYQGPGVWGRRHSLRSLHDN
ncbi:hypothetical protein D9M71_560570 [compost metagenome]